MNLDGWWVMLSNTMPINFQYLQAVRGRRGRDRMVVGFTTTNGVSVYHHWCCGFESRSGRGVHYYVITFVSDLWQVSGFFQVLRFPPPIKLTTTIYLKYCWKWSWTPSNKQTNKPNEMSMAISTFYGLRSDFPCNNPNKPIREGISYSCEPQSITRWHLLLRKNFIYRNRVINHIYIFF